MRNLGQIYLFSTLFFASLLRASVVLFRGKGVEKRGEVWHTRKPTLRTITITTGGRQQSAGKGCTCEKDQLSKVF